MSVYKKYMGLVYTIVKVHERIQIYGKKCIQKWLTDVYSGYIMHISNIVYETSAVQNGQKASLWCFYREGVLL